MQSKETEVLPSAILFIIIFSRLFSEIISTFLFERSNTLWAGLGLFLIFVILWPYLALRNKGEIQIVKTYLPIILYLLFISFRTDYFDFDSLKAFISEFIIWAIFLITNKCCQQNEKLSENIEKVIVLLIKLNILFGLYQLAYSWIISLPINSIGSLLDLRAVHSVFSHPNVFVIISIPFSIYFLSKKQYWWSLITILVCAFSGARSPFLIFVCMFLPIYKVAKNKEIQWVDLYISLSAILVIYFALIYSNQEIRVYENYQSRFNLASFQWRVNYWKNFLVIDDSVSLLIGHGLGAAEIDVFGPGSLSPHNDYVKMFYDIGIIGLLIYFVLILFMLKLLMNSRNRYGVLMYIFIISFSLSDNLIHFSYSMWVFTFLACIAMKKVNLGNLNDENSAG